ncbi:Uu.00g017540.m01.CDS01 [Anthostomella pinea]|uniref:Uu.00g017540.m01.CDS01 n=1 Tax=Anthostomella pinea TaxID=933095 RepID=A0AAI8VZT5_9PEZI|nr:Uu.00g017540.m01.CDS01 [Anthostomella pinea]
MAYLTLAAISAFVSVAASAALPVLVTEVSHDVVSPTVTEPPSPTAWARALPPRQNQVVTMTIVNSMGAAVSTSHQLGGVAPTVIAGGTGSGPMAANETAILALPSGYHGGIAVGRPGKKLTDAASLIESSFVDLSGQGKPQAYADVSFVNGFSLPMVCSCDNTVVTGCNIDMFALNTCQDVDDGGACINTARSDSYAKVDPPDFFVPCEHAAYTWPSDDAATTNGGDTCNNGITCCIGTSCAPNPAQDQNSSSSAVSGGASSYSSSSSTYSYEPSATNPAAAYTPTTYTPVTTSTAAAGNTAVTTSTAPVGNTAVTTTVMSTATATATATADPGECCQWGGGFGGHHGPP